MTTLPIRYKALVFAECIAQSDQDMPLFVPPMRWKRVKVRCIHGDEATMDIGEHWLR